MATKPTRTQVRYSDIKTNLDPHPDHRDVTRNTNEDAIKRSIRNILLTDRYERFYQPTFGAGVADFLFENYDLYTEIELRDRVTSAINDQEPRAILRDVQINGDPDRNSITIKVVFSTINNPDPIVLNVILERVR